MPQLEKVLENPSSKGLQARFPCCDSRTMPCTLLQWNADWTSLGTHKRLPEVLIVTREKPHLAPQLIKTMKFARHREMRPFFFPPGHREQSSVLFQNTTEGLTSFRPLNGLQEIPVATREERSSLLSLETRPDSPNET